MANDLGVMSLHQPFQSHGEIAAHVLNQVFHVVVHPPSATHGLAGTPHQAVQQRPQKIWSHGTESLHHFWMPGEQVIDTVVVAVSVRPDGQQVLDHRSGTLQSSTLNGPIKGRNRLCSHRDVQQLHGTLVAGSNGYRLPQRFALVRVDRLHHDSTALEDRSHEDLGDEGQGPAESLLSNVVCGHAADSIHGARHKRSKELRRDSIAYVPKPQGRNVLHHHPRAMEHLHRHLKDLVGNEVQTSR
mmetsp:Transcript_44376/g.103558  ORF Transcript_44376/g.103558 Transcript_44376/m.103558 type:complete len:243 (-) Transcript_44376:1169-1897(-)